MKETEELVNLLSGWQNLPPYTGPKQESTVVKHSFWARETWSPGLAPPLYALYDLYLSKPEFLICKIGIMTLLKNHCTNGYETIAEELKN